MFMLRYQIYISATKRVSAHIRDPTLCYLFLKKFRRKHFLELLQIHAIDKCEAPRMVQDTPNVPHELKEML